MTDFKMCLLEVEGSPVMATEKDKRIKTNYMTAR